ncbi:TPA: hypothetical protein ACH3X3_008536 [Trebouxia sp. C0006]
MGCSPLPACAQAVDRSQLDSDWNPHHVRWLPATVWAAQYAARGTEGFFSKTSAVSQMCSACPKVATQKCAKCKLVYFCNRDCQRRAFPMHKHFCQKPEDCENENLRIVVMENGRMECAGQDRGSRYRTARNYLLQGNSAMDQQQYSEAWGYVQKALVIGKQLKDWTVQSNALRVLSLCCRPMGGPQDSERNVTWWDEALTEARKHGDPFLEAMVLKTMGYAAAQKYGDYRALEESAQLWLAIMKALRLRGESGEPGLRRCPTQMLITKQYLAMGKKKGGGWEGLLREALVVSALASHVAHVCNLWLSCLRMFCNLCAVNADHKSATCALCHTMLEYLWCTNSMLFLAVY